MPVEVRWEPGGVCRRYHGVVTVAERQASLVQVCNDARFDELRFAITDYRDVVQYETTPQATEETAALHIGPLLTNPKILLASIATDEHIVAAIRHFISLEFISQPYRIFATMEEARAWIEQTRVANRGRTRPR